MLKGEKVKLRIVEPEDAEILYEWENDIEHWRVSNTQTPFSMKTIKAYVNGVQDIYTDRQLRLMICVGKDARPVGAVDLFEFEPNHGRVGVGILIHKNDRKNGYAREALKLIKHYAFEVLFLHQLYCNISVSNSASLKLFSELGYEIVGTKKDWNRSSDGYEDEYLLQIMNKRE